jgi:hypothetical protein
VFRFSLKLLSKTFHILKRTERDMIKHTYSSSCKVPVIRVILLWNFYFIYKVSKNSKILNFMEIHQDGAELFHMDGRMHRHRQTAKRTDGRTDWQTVRQTDSQTGRQVGNHGESSSRFSQFWECAKKWMLITLSNAIIYWMKWKESNKDTPRRFLNKKSKWFCHQIRKVS